MFEPAWMIDPPEAFESSWPDAESTCIIDGAHGIYVPQQFCQRYEKTENVCQEDWDICLAGPDHEHYWESWDAILNDWGGEEFDELNGVYRIWIEQDGDLFQYRQLDRVEK
ncbi:MAG: hypothetical protein ACO24H_03535 [Polynucleobacter sp.]